MVHPAYFSFYEVFSDFNSTILQKIDLNGPSSNRAGIWTHDRVPTRYKIEHKDTDWHVLSSS